MSTRTEETPEEAVWRLALKAREEGVKLYHDRRDERYYASSVSNPGQLHYLTGVSCDCPGFASHQRCKHYAALLVALGWTGSDPEPDPEPITGRIVRCKNVAVSERSSTRAALAPTALFTTGWFALTVADAAWRSEQPRLIAGGRS